MSTTRIESVTPGTVIAEFLSGSDALHFKDRCCDESYTVTAGINLPYAVRKAEPNQFADVTTPAVNLTERLRLRLVGVTDRGRAGVESIQRRLPHGEDL